MGASDKGIRDPSGQLHSLVSTLDALGFGEGLGPVIHPLLIRIDENKIRIGARQQGRPVCENVICCPAEKTAIAAAVKKALSPAFAAVAKGAKSPYNGGDTSGRIVNILLEAARRPGFGGPKRFYDGP